MQHSRGWGKLGVVVHTFSPSTWEAEAGGNFYEFEASLVYIASAMTWERPCLKNKKKEEEDEEDEEEKKIIHM